jgi:hypothetical protein
LKELEMTFVKWTLVLAVALAAASCGGAPPPEAPASPGRQDPVYVEATEIIQLESYPVQVLLRVDGQLPDPCHEAVWSVSDPDVQGRIDVALHSEAPEGLACIQVLKQVTLRIPIGSFRDGSYSIWLNDEKIGEFSL